jgi:hypothetical protein
VVEQVLALIKELLVLVVLAVVVMEQLEITLLLVVELLILVQAVVVVVKELVVFKLTNLVQAVAV